MVNFLTLLLVWITVDQFGFLLKMAVRAAFFWEGRVGTESEAYPTRLMNDVVLSPSLHQGEGRCDHGEEFFTCLLTKEC